MIYPIDAFPNRTITHNNQEYLYFGGTAYLGLQTLKEFQEIFIESIKKYGTNYGASRKANIQFSIYSEAESVLAKIIGAETCYTLSSGFLAGQSILQFLKKNDYTCFYAPNTHAALHATASKNADTFDELSKQITQSNHSKKALLLDAIDFSGNNYPDFKWLKQFPLDDLLVIVDDSHGLGIVGKNGSGAFSILQKKGVKNLLLCSSLGKGYGIQGGVIAGNKRIIYKLQEQDVFAASSPTPPAYLATFVNAQNIYKNQRGLVFERVHQFKKQIEKNLSHFSFMDDYPTFSFSDMALTKHLEHNNIIITNFKYPNENSNTVQRIVICARHTKENIIKLANTVNTFF
jgi:7-keto-8-aminopelargonate synthetase-like enzyme